MSPFSLCVSLQRNSCEIVKEKFTKKNKNFFVLLKKLLEIFKGSDDTSLVMKTTTHTIKSHHDSLASAVTEAKPDLSYNESEAWKKIKDIDKNCKRAFIAEDGTILFVFSCDIEILHEFTPFDSCVCDTPFRIAIIDGDTITIGEPSVKKSKAGREFFANASKVNINILAA